MQSENPYNFEPDPTQLLAVIQTLTEIAKQGLDLNSVMTLVAERSQLVTGAAGAVVELAEGNDMVYRAVSGLASDMLGLRLDRKTSLSGLCVEAATILRCDDSESDPRVDREACRKVGLRSMVVVPLIYQGEVIGALKVFSPEPLAFGEVETRLLSLMSELIAAAMYHATRFGKDELFWRATRDPLTGLANRALFFDRLRHSLTRAKRDQVRLGVAMVDMDGLKPINDQYGHRAGDAAIKVIAERIVMQVRHSDTVARLGGDEFAVVLATIEDRHSGIQVGQRIADECQRPFIFEGRHLPIGASIGIAIYPDDGEHPDVLIERADQAMYAVKRQKKNVFDTLRS